VENRERDTIGHENMSEDVEQTNLEDNKRFSESILWKLQQQAYSQFGPQAWIAKGVPFYLTCNPHFVRQNAQVALGYVRDCIRNKLINREEPFYIFDLGAGSGRFGYLFLKDFLSFTHQLYGSKLKVRYVMTDIIQANLDFLRNHLPLQQFIEEGVLDFAYFKHDQVDSLKLLVTGKTLETVSNPAIIIGNYFFDTIPQDYFRVDEGKLEEGRVSVYADKGKISTDKADIIKHLHTHFFYAPLLDPTNYYPEAPEINRLLVEYAERFDGCNFLFPLGAFQSINFFNNLANGKLLLMAADQGLANERQMRQFKEPKIDKHGTFSVSVCYVAIADYMRNLGGFGLLTTFSDPLFVVISAILGGNQEEYRETKLAFDQNVDNFEAKDYWKLTGYFDEHLSDLSLEQLLLVLKFGLWDPINFYTFFEHLRLKLHMATPDQKIDLIQIADCIYRQFYPISAEEGGLLINLGVLCFEIGNYQGAINYFEKALELMGETAQIYKNISACYSKIGELPKAFAYLDKALKFE